MRKLLSRQGLLHVSGDDRPRPAASFSAFLKRPGEAQKPVRQAASFSSFLRKQPDQAQPAAVAATENLVNAAAAAVVEAGPGPEQKPVTVLYGTEYGFSKEIAEKLVGKLKEGRELWCAHRPSSVYNKCYSYTEFGAISFHRPRVISGNIQEQEKESCLATLYSR